MNKKAFLVIAVGLFIAFGSIYTNEDDNVFALVPSQLAGAWESVDDLQSVREFTIEGDLIESYSSEIIGDIGKWSIFSFEEAIEYGFSTAHDQEGVYLLIETEEGPLYFLITELSNENLKLIYLDRGNTLEYKRR